MNMPNKFVNNLTDENIMKLEQLWQTSSKFRRRNGSQAILLSFQRVPIDERAKICNVGRDALSSWINRWETDGYDGLSDQPKSGRRPTLSKKGSTQSGQNSVASSTQSGSPTLCNRKENRQASESWNVEKNA